MSSQSTLEKVGWLVASLACFCLAVSAGSAVFTLLNFFFVLKNADDLYMRIFHPEEEE